jgi:hypothetical protein
VQDKELFPLCIDRFPIQLLSFLRFARIQDVAQLARASFEQDVIISPMNEYEVLQLVMAELRERLQEYLANQVRRTLTAFLHRSRRMVCTPGTLSCKNDHRSWYPVSWSWYPGKPC